MDPISNMLVAIKNAGARRKFSLRVPFSKFSFSVAELLSKEGYIGSVSEVLENEKKFINIELKYIGKKLAINEIQKISKPGRRVYVQSKEIPRVKGNIGLAFVSTSSGVMTNNEARKKGLGGEVILQVW